MLLLPLLVLAAARYPGAVGQVDPNFTLVNDWLQLNSSKTDSIIRCISPDEKPEKINFSRYLETGQGPNLPKFTQKFLQGEPVYALIVLMRARGGAARFGAFACEVASQGVATQVVTLKLPPSNVAHFIATRPFVVASVGEKVELAMVRQVDLAPLPARWVRNGKEDLPQWTDQLTVTIPNVTLADAGVYELFYRGQRAKGLHGIVRLIVRGCPADKYGVLCDQGCPPCYNGGVCHDTWGVCVCPAGFMGLNCEQSCGSNRYGAECNKYCSPGATGSSVDNGCAIHLFCKPDPYGCTCGSGFKGIRCDEECEDGTFGPDCVVPCHCASDVPCNKITGACQDNLCAPGWKGPSCQVPVENANLRVCPPARYGDSCQYECHCSDGVSCSPEDGCPAGCEMGWTNQHCNECSAAFYGPSCNQTCACRNNASCDSLTGACKCLHQWKGLFCNETLPHVVEALDQEVILGNSVTISCVVSGVPQPNLSFSIGEYPPSPASCEPTLGGQANATCRGAVVINPRHVGPLRVRCIATNVHGVTHADFQVRVHSVPIVSSPPELVEEAGADWAMVRWTPAKSSSEEVNLSYIVSYRVSDHDIWLEAGLPTSHLFKNITGLLPYTHYEVSVRARIRGPGGEGPFSPPLNFTTACSAPTMLAIPQYLTAENISHDSIHLSWKHPMPSELRCSLKGYELSYAPLQNNSSPQQVLLNASATDFLLYNLTANTAYLINLYAVSAVQRAPSRAHINVVTKEYLPGPVINFRHHYTRDSSSLMLTWEVPRVTNGKLGDYKLEYRLLNQGRCNESAEGEYVTLNTSTNQVTLDKLFPYSLYEAQVRASTARGYGPFSRLEFTTEEAKPSSSPLNVTIEAIGEDFIEVSWASVPCLQRNGILTEFEVQLLLDSTRDLVTSFLAPLHVLNKRFSDLIPYTEYRIRTRAATAVGFGPFSKPLTVMTLEAAPPPPSVLNVDPLDTDIIVRWEPHFPPYGEIQGFNLRLTDLEGATIKEETLPPSKRRYVFENLTLNTRYQFQIRASTTAGWGNWSSTYVQATLPEYLLHAPAPQVISNQGKIYVTFPSNDPRVSAYRIIVEDTRNFLPINKNLLAGYEDARAKNLPYYIAGELRAPFDNSTFFVLGDEMYYNGFFNFPLDGSLSYQVRVQAILEHEGIRKSYLSDSASILQANQTVSATVTFLRMPWLTYYAIVVFSLIGLVFIAIIIVILVYAKRHRSSRKGSLPVQLLSDIPGTTPFSTWQSRVDPHRRRMSSYCTTILDEDDLAPEDDNVLEDFRTTLRRAGYPDSNMNEGTLIKFSTGEKTKKSAGRLRHPIPLNNLEACIRERRLSTIHNFAAEFEQLYSGQTSPWTVGKRLENKKKNRYLNVLPYDYNRVILRGSPQDYINASYIDGYQTSKEYIATQGPTLQTYNDLWRMVWEEHVTTVVMLTSLVENKKAKCGLYWPEFEDGVQGQSYGDLYVLAIHAAQPLDHSATFLKRTFLLRQDKCSDTLRVEHFQYVGWPETDVPFEMDPFLDFLATIRQCQGSTPLVVHGSAGVGRTGTFIALLTLMDQMETESKVDVLGCVAQLRLQRVNMVQTLAQYAFIYEVLLAIFTQKERLNSSE